MTPTDGAAAVIGGRSLSEILVGAPSVLEIPDARARIRAANAASGTWVVVLDDDPTGSQSVHGVTELTRWRPDDLSWAFDQPTGTLFILTNSRSLGEPQAAAIVADVASAVAAAADRAGISYVLVARGDSTLRGHFPLETDVLQDLARRAGHPYDAVLVAPAYLEAGRITVGDVQYVGTGDRFLPVGATEYASDASFGFRSSDLREYVEEKTKGRYAAEDVLHLTLEDIRLGGPARVGEILRGARHGAPIVVNAAEPADLDVVVLGLLDAEAAGTRVLYRAGPTFVSARSGADVRAPLRRAEIFAKRDVDGHGLVVVGSHVPLTTRQVGRLLESGGIEPVELDVPALLDPDLAGRELERCNRELEARLLTGDALLVTSRRRVDGDTSRASLDIARAVSAALVEVTRRVVASSQVAWVLAKGGITSSDIATQALGIARATVIGQLFPGTVSVWVHEGGEGSDLHGLPYVVFAGNVGDEDSLAAAVSILRGPSDA
jgi:uncharacterized protein YgbK (DUF1537 family)